MDAVKAKSNFEGGDGDGEDKSVGCPLEKILEFLQTVMTKDYKSALVLAAEVEKHEPNNELVMEYKTVLQKIVNKEEENDNTEGSDSDSNSSSPEEAGDYSEELTTSSETDSISEGEEDSESSSETHSITSSEESDENEEDLDDNEVEVNVSESNQNEENVLVAEDEKSMNATFAAESLDNSISSDKGNGDK